MSTQIEVMNAALTAIGAQRVNSVDEASEGARLAAANYDRARKYVLRLHPWNSATSRIALPKLAAAPAFGFTNAFQLPTDCLRVVEVDSALPYRIEGRKLLTDEGSISITYVRDETVLSNLDPLLVDLIALRLAILIGRRVTGDIGAIRDLRQEWQRAEIAARHADAGEEPADYLWEDVWSVARFGGDDDILRYGTYWVT